MSSVQERYAPMVVGVNATVQVTANGVGGFLALTAGTATLTRKNTDGTTTVIINAVPVTAGVYTPMPFFLGRDGGTFTLAGGASGTLGVS